ncbi:hypothetical protein HanRHA438_Chr14g0650401 [Helianthus annuus]|nr:hypothetical protein HanRHA438_Chr14g0650401 [Helianthus annuus]
MVVVEVVVVAAEEEVLGNGGGWRRLGMEMGRVLVIPNPYPLDICWVITCQALGKPIGIEYSLVLRLILLHILILSLYMLYT